ncbi:MAG: helix-turn-helix domain-containing protein [Fibromonadaceae bacterium]|nr:helix-turn-helix domain-containing protein [Fibromonadaceae bacterium]
MKSFLTIILVLIALCGGFYALVRFSGLDPDEFLDFIPKPSKASEIRSSIDPDKLQVLYDSLESINFVMRRETDERRMKNLKETQKNLWDRIVLARNAMSKADAPQSIKEEETELIDSLIKGISITAAILLVTIIFLIIKITRRSKEVEKVTERLKSLQSEPAPPPPLGGIDPTVIPQRYRPSPLPQVKPYEQQSGTETPKAKGMPEMPRLTAEQPRLRKTAKQRVTEAVQKMREALDRLRSDSTAKIQTPRDPTGVSRLTKTQIRVPSLNSTRITPSGDETTYDRRGREKKQILDYAKQGRTPSEIAKWLNLPRDQVETVIRLARERGE